MATGNIEFVQGKEQHSSNWSKYYVKGLDGWQIKEDFPANCHDNHHSYQGYTCLNVPEGTLFTIFEQSGTKNGTDSYTFTIAQVTAEGVAEDKALYGSGFVQGNFKVIAQGSGKTKAPRLMNWWLDSGNPQTLEFALHCAANIDKRGVKECPPFVPAGKTELETLDQTSWRSEVEPEQSDDTLTFGEDRWIDVLPSGEVILHYAERSADGKLDFKNEIPLNPEQLQELIDKLIEIQVTS